MEAHAENSGPFKKCEVLIVSGCMKQYERILIPPRRDDLPAACSPGIL